MDVHLVDSEIHSPRAMTKRKLGVKVPTSETTRDNLSTPSEPLNWSSEFYDVLQNQIGGGKPKMKWYFKENGSPSSTIFDSPPKDDSDREKLIDTLQVEPRPGVLRLMDEAKTTGIKLAVRSAATKSSVILCLENLIGMQRFRGLDCFLAVKNMRCYPHFIIGPNFVAGKNKDVMYKKFLESVARGRTHFVESCGLPISTSVLLSFSILLLLEDVEDTKKTVNIQISKTRLV